MKPEEVKAYDVMKGLLETCKVYAEAGVDTEVITNGLIAAGVTAFGILADDVGDKATGTIRGIAFTYERTEPKSE